MNLRLRSATIITLVLLAVSAGAQQLKIKEDSGHVSPVRAKLTLANDKTRDVVITAIGGKLRETFGDKFFTHNFFVRTDAGVSKRTLWIDQIAAIRGLNTMRTASSEFKIQMKDGASFDAMFVGSELAGSCDAFAELSQSTNPCSLLRMQNSDESTEIINMRDLKSIEFLPFPRKDKLGNSMFDTWLFSPFTGEKLSN